VESRKARKLRRQAAGTFKPTRIDWKTVVAVSGGGAGNGRDVEDVGREEGDKALSEGQIAEVEPAQSERKAKRRERVRKKEGTSKKTVTSKAGRAKAQRDQKAEGKSTVMTEEMNRDEDVEPNQVESVLAKIDELDGSELKSVRRERKASKRDEKAAASEKTKTLKSTQTSMEKSTKKADDLKPKLTTKKEAWAVQKEALKRKFGEQGWQPRKRLSPDTMEGIRALHASDPNTYTTATLSEHFKVTPEAIRRILKSKWRPNEAEAEDRRIRWERRGVKKWTEMAEQGVRPPAKWRHMGIGSEGGVKEGMVPKRKKKGKDEGQNFAPLVGEEFGEGFRETSM
jgi:hypothetical protein